MVYFIKVVTIRCICLTGKYKKKKKDCDICAVHHSQLKKTKVYCYILGKTKSFKKKRNFIGCFFRDAAFSSVTCITWFLVGMT